MRDDEKTIFISFGRQYAVSWLSRPGKQINIYSFAADFIIWENLMLILLVKKAHTGNDRFKILQSPHFIFYYFARDDNTFIPMVKWQRDATNIIPGCCIVYWMIATSLTDERNRKIFY